MTDTGVSPAIRRFVLTCIPSVPYLEALLLMRSEPAWWNNARLAERLYVGSKMATVLIEELVGAGIVEASPENHCEFHYRPRSPEIQELIDELAATYSTHLVEVTQLIHSKTDRKAQQFADAFKWRKDS